MVEHSAVNRQVAGSSPARGGQRTPCDFNGHRGFIIFGRVVSICTARALIDETVERDSAKDG